MKNWLRSIGKHKITENTVSKFEALNFRMDTVYLNLNYSVRNQRKRENLEQFITRMLQLYDDPKPNLSEQRFIECIIQRVNPEVRDFLEIEKPQDLILIHWASKYESRKKVNNRYYRCSRFSFSHRQFTIQETFS